MQLMWFVDASHVRIDDDKGVPRLRTDACFKLQVKLAMMTSLNRKLSILTTPGRGKPHQQKRKWTKKIDHSESRHAKADITQLEQ